MSMHALLRRCGVLVALTATAALGPHPLATVTAVAAVVEQVSTPSDAPRSADSLEQALQTGRARLEFLYVPATGFAYVDQSGRLTGATVELLRDFAGFVAQRHELQVEVQWLEQPQWSRFYAQVQASEGGVFGVGNVTITAARRAELDFSPPYLHNVAVLISHESVPELETIDQFPQRFNGLAALPFTGTLHESRLKTLRDRWMPQLQLQPVQSNDELIEQIASGEGYFGYIDIYNYWRAREAGRPLRRHTVADDRSESFGVILPHGSDWTAVIDAFFHEQDYAGGERFREHLQRHLGDDLAELLLQQ